MRLFIRRKVLVLAAAAAATLSVLAPAAPALADTLSPPPATLPATPTDWAQTVTLDQFDPALGDLISATFTFDSFVNSTLQAENLSTSSSCTATLGWEADVTVDTPNGGLTVPLSQFESESLTVFDGTIDFGGTSGITTTGTVTGPTQTLTVTDSAALAPYIGTGTFSVDMTASATTNVTGCGNIAQNISTSAGAELSVVYEYTPPPPPEPAIDIEKATNGEDADTPTGPEIPVGGPVNWTYVVTNTGNVDLTNVTVVDDQGVAVTCPQDTLAIGESMTCTATGTATLGQYANLGTTTGDAPDGTTVTDEDPSHYIGSSIAEPAIDIEKATNGEDADTPTGPQIPVGGPVNWTYVVTNTGNVDLTNVTVVDDQGVAVTCPQDTLAIGESMTCTATGTATLGQYANLGTTTGDAPDGTTVTDDDPSHYIGVEETPEPAIDIEKATNGEDADTPTGPWLVEGDPVNWTYVVTNTGNVDLTNVTVVDDQGVAVTCPQDTLAIGESMTCTATGTAVLGQYANLGTTTGDAPDGTTVTDEDPSHYYGANRTCANGCTWNYWANPLHLDKWTGYSPSQQFSDVFGVDVPGTLLDVIRTPGRNKDAIAREGVAALLNAAHPDVPYPVTEAEIIAKVKLAIETGDPDAARMVIGQIDSSVCPLGSKHG